MIGILADKPLADFQPGLAAPFEGMQVNAPVLERVPQPLDYGVAHPPACPVHGRP